MTELLSIIVTAVSSSGVTGFFTWFFTRKKYNSEVDNLLITNMKESLEFYKTLSDDNKNRLDEVLTLNKSIIELNERLLALNTELLLLNRALQLQVDELNLKIDSINRFSCAMKGCNLRIIIKEPKAKKSL